MVSIELTQGKSVIVDNIDYEWLSQWKWFYVGNGAAGRKEKISDTGKLNRKTIYMHREILSAPDNYEVDHINGDRLDNRRGNLRLCTSSQNKCNRQTDTRNKLGLKNICWHKGMNKYIVQINMNKKQRFKGYYDTIEDAIVDRNKALKEIHGTFARFV